MFIDSGVPYKTCYARSHDISIAYQVIGDGPRDLIFVPGIVSHVEFFHELPGYTEFLEGLASFARVVVLDKRGNGLSDRVIGASSLEDRMDDIRAVMDAVGSERPRCSVSPKVGRSACCSRRPTPLGSKRSSCTRPSFATGACPATPTFGNTTRTESSPTSCSSGTAPANPCSASGPRGSKSPVPSRCGARRSASRTARAGFAPMYEALLETDVHAALPSVQAPCLVVHGTTMSMFEQQSRYLAEHLPDARLVTLDGVDHFPWFADVDKVVSEVEEFVTGARSAVADERVLATLLFTDIVGSTEQAATMGDRRWHEVIENYYGLVRRCIERFRGHEVSTEGDGFIARFEGPARAVSCARAIREGVQGLGVEIRAGVHTGEIELRGDEVTGLAVHIGARVVALAGSGEVLVSRTVKDLVVGSGIEFSDRGTHELKGVPDTWQLYAVAG